MRCHQNERSREKAPHANKLASSQACALAGMSTRWEMGEPHVCMYLTIANLCKIASSAFIVFVMKNFLDVAHTQCITLDKTNNLCLSETTTPGAGSKCDLYLLYLGEAKNVFVVVVQRGTNGVVNG